MPTDTTTDVNEARFEAFFYHFLQATERKVSAAVYWPRIKPRTVWNTGLFKMIVGVLTTCHRQYT